MGWTGTNKPNGQTMQQFFTQEFSSVEILACRTIQRRETYMAVRRKDDPNGKVFGLVCLLHFVPRSYYNVTYKEMSESTGPCASGCPKDVLDLLSPLECLYSSDSKSYEWAKEWRERCEKNLRRRARTKIRRGMHIRFEKPLEFIDGSHYQEFEVVSGRPMRFTALDAPYPRRCHISRDVLLTTPYEVIS